MVSLGFGPAKSSTEGKPFAFFFQPLVAAASLQCLRPPTPLSFLPPFLLFLKGHHSLWVYLEANYSSHDLISSVSSEVPAYHEFWKDTILSTAMCEQHNDTGNTSSLRANRMAFHSFGCKVFNLGTLIYTYIYRIIPAFSFHDMGGSSIYIL